MANSGGFKAPSGLREFASTAAKKKGKEFPLFSWRGEDGKTQRHPQNKSRFGVEKWEFGVEKWGFGVVCAGNVPVEGLSLILPRLLCGILSTEDGEKEN